MSALRISVLVAIVVVAWMILPQAIGNASLPRATPVPQQAILVSAARHGPNAVQRAASRRLVILAGFRRAELRRAAAEQQRAAAAADQLHYTLWLHGRGAQLYTTWNQPVTLKSINWFGFEYSPFVPGGLDRVPLDRILLSLRTLGFNALRIPFADETVESNPVVTSGVGANPDLRGLHSLDIMQRIIERAHDFGIRVVLCNSRSEAGRGPELVTGLWYTNRYPESAWFNDWETLARRFRRDDAFVGADLRNEPHITGGLFTEDAYFRLGPLWGAYRGTYYHDRDWHYAAEQLGNDLLSINPHLLIIVEGVQIYFDPFRNVLTGGLWGANLVGVQYDPIVLSHPSQLVYSVHEYGPHMWQGNWFGPKTTYASLARRWDHLWGYLLSARSPLRAPIYVGEFGTCHEYWACISSAQGWKQGFWFQSFVRYMHVHSEVSWAYWALNPDGPFHPGDVNFYSLTALDWRHYYPLVSGGLKPLLAEPNGLWGSGLSLRLPAGLRPFAPEPGCVGLHSCTSSFDSRVQVRLPGQTRPTAPVPVTSVQVQTNVPYAGQPNPYREGDLYLPVGRSSTPRPAAVLLHGGVFAAGGKDTPAMGALASALARHGYVVFNIDYRLVGHGGRFPRNIVDVKVAAGFLAANAGRWHIKPGQIAAVGVGVGGYLAMMAADTPDTGFFAPRHSAVGGHVAAAASIFAPDDLRTIGRASGDLAEAQDLTSYLRATYAANPGVYKQASVPPYVSTSAPTIFFHGLNDNNAPFISTFRLYRYLKQASIGTELIDLPGAPHTLTDLTRTGDRQALAQIESFFDGIFYKPPEPSTH